MGRANDNDCYVQQRQDGKWGRDGRIRDKDTIAPGDEPPKRDNN